MKLFYIFAMILAFAGVEKAGSFSEPVVESDVEEAAASSSAGWLPLILIAGAAVLLLSGDEPQIQGP